MQLPVVITIDYDKMRTNLSDLPVTFRYMMLVLRYWPFLRQLYPGTTL